MIPEWIFQVIGMAATASAVYAGIKADLATLHNKADSAIFQAQKAHERIDHLLQR